MVLAPLRNARRALLPAAAICVVVAAVIAALVLVGSPAEQRGHWADSIRVRDLQAIKSAVDQFYASQKRLPDSLARLKQKDDSLRIADVQTREPYAYRVLSPKEYELSATFVTNTLRESEAEASRNEHDWHTSRAMPFWKHPNGLAHFRLTVETSVAP